MDRQPRPINSCFHQADFRPTSPLAQALGRGVVAAACVAIAVVSATVTGGCSWLEHGKLEQYQSENERLIGDFRAERQRSSVLDERNEALSDRVAHLEDRLASVSESLREETIDESGRSKTPDSDDSAVAPSPEPAAPRSQGLFAPFERWRGRP